MAQNFCPQCGGKLEPGQTKCSFCGKELTNLSAENAAGTQYSNQYTGQDNNQYGGQSSAQYTSQDNNQYGGQNNVQYTSQNNNQYGGQSSNTYTSNYQDNTANYPYQSSVPSAPNNSGSANGLQIAGLVLGIIGIISCCCYGIVGIIFGVAGLICSILGNKQSKNGIGTAGLICSIVALVLGVLALIYYIIAIAYGVDEYLNGNYYY